MPVSPKRPKPLPGPVEQVVATLEQMYKQGWNERNGGNLSYAVTAAEARAITPNQTPLRTFDYDIDMTAIAGRHFLVTATGSFFKNARSHFDRDLGLVRIRADGKALELLWGYENDNRPTSEANTHMLCHIARLTVDPLQRLILHAHPANAVAMTHVLPPDEDLYSATLWKMQTESIIVFPEGVGVLPWMVCGGVAIGQATRAKMAAYKAVFWSMHGVFCAGRTLDEGFGLLETIEKASEIYMKAAPLGIKNEITDSELVELAKAFKVDYKKSALAGKAR